MFKLINIISFFISDLLLMVTNAIAGSYSGPDFQIKQLQFGNING